jgi:hypothetical protein
VFRNVVSLQQALLLHHDRKGTFASRPLGYQVQPFQAANAVLQNAVFQSVADGVCAAAPAKEADHQEGRQEGTPPGAKGAA